MGRPDKAGDPPTPHAELRALAAAAHRDASARLRQMHRDAMTPAVVKLLDRIDMHQQPPPPGVGQLEKLMNADAGMGSPIEREHLKLLAAIDDLRRWHDAEAAGLESETRQGRPPSKTASQWRTLARPLAGRPSKDGAEDTRIHTAVEEWRDEQERLTGRRPLLAAACRHVAKVERRSEAEAGAIRSAYTRHRRRSKT